MTPEGEPIYRTVLVEPGPPPKRRSRKTLFVVLGLVGAVLAVGVLLLVAAVRLAIDATETTPPSEADRLAVVTTDDLVPWMPDFVPDPNLETFTRTRHFDGSSELDYEYDASDADDFEEFLTPVLERLDEYE